jgi:uncharacterized membrane protein
MTEIEVVSEEARLKSLKNLAQLVYLLYALMFFTGGLTAIAGVMLDYIRREEVAGTWLEGHFRWQIRTFWFGLLWTAVGIATYLLLVGIAILFANTCWIIYRIIKGWLNLSENKPMPV